MTDTTGANGKVTDATGIDDKMAGATGVKDKAMDTTGVNDNDVSTAAESEPTRPDATALAKEVADYKDKLLRSLADMENLRRRTEREVADARVYGISSFARDIVGVADNVHRALEAAGESASIEGPAKTLCEGVELIERELLKILEKYGVKKFDPQGAKFDPNLHQAIFEVSDPNVASGSVAQVIQPGYMIGERVLRPAMVGVSKGAPKAVPPEQPADEKQSG